MNDVGSDDEMNYESTPLGSFTAIALPAPGIVDVVAFETLPIFWTGHEAPHRTRLFALFAVVSPIEVGKTALPA